MQKQKGFTIIELIVVIAIIAILAAIVMVNVTQYIQKAKVSSAIAQLDEISKAINIYYTDTGTVPPVDHDFADDCETAILGSGNFQPKPENWSGPYISWPKNPWGGNYHFEINLATNGGYSISVEGIPDPAMQEIDNRVDDGNLSTGEVIKYDTGRMEYSKGFSDYVSIVEQACSL